MIFWGIIPIAIAIFDSFTQEETVKCIQNVLDHYSELLNMSNIMPVDHEAQIMNLKESELNITRFIDEGRFSVVYEAQNTSSGNKIICKVMKHKNVHKIMHEHGMLLRLKNITNAIKYFGLYFIKSDICFLFESIGSDTQYLSHKVTSQLTAMEVRLYILKLLITLEECRSNRIMHRDVKPRNIIINRRSESLRLIDFGLSEVWRPNKTFTSHAASRNYKSPELLLGLTTYDMAVDIWSAGCVLAGLIFLKEPFFEGDSAYDQLLAIGSICSHQAILDLASKHQQTLSSSILVRNVTECFRNQSRNSMDTVSKRLLIPWSRFRTNLNSHLCPDDALDLLSQMLQVDPQERYTASQCIKHRYFDPVRHLVTWPQTASAN